MAAELDISLGWRSGVANPQLEKMDVRVEIPLGLAKWTHRLFSLSKK
jgi:hypothetical protein